MFNVRSKPARLELARVRPEDEADYRCRVDFRRGRTTNTVHALRVVVPPNELRIYDTNRQQVHAVARHPSAAASAQAVADTPALLGPLDEGQQLTLVCVAFGGRPRPNVVWRRDFQPVAGDGTSLSSSSALDWPDASASAELRVTKLTRNHLLSVFTCQASNHNATNQLQASVTLDLNRKWNVINFTHTHWI